MQAQHQSTALERRLSEQEAEWKLLRREADHSAAVLAAALQREGGVRSERDAAHAAGQAQQRQHADALGALQKELEGSQVRSHDFSGYHTDRV